MPVLFRKQRDDRMHHLSHPWAMRASPRAVQGLDDPTWINDLPTSWGLGADGVVACSSINYLIVRCRSKPCMYCICPCSSVLLQSACAYELGIACSNVLVNEVLVQSNRPKAML